MSDLPTPGQWISGERTADKVRVFGTYRGQSSRRGLLVIVNAHGVVVTIAEESWKEVNGRV